MRCSGLSSAAAYFFIQVPDWSTELAERQRIFVEVVRLAHALDVEFARPTQTLAIGTFPDQPRRAPSAEASGDALRRISESFGKASESARPRGLGVFVPPHEEHG